MSVAMYPEFPSSSDNGKDKPIYGAWSFNFFYGSQTLIPDPKLGEKFLALAVRDGDVVCEKARAVPEPSSLVLVVSGIVGLIAGRKLFRRRQCD